MSERGAAFKTAQVEITGKINNKTSVKYGQEVSAIKLLCPLFHVFSCPKCLCVFYSSQTPD